MLALGPLTSVGAAREAPPALVEYTEIIYVMGGAVDVYGSSVSDENTIAEWNIYCDPHAARIVFECGAPITLVLLDATIDVPVTPEIVAQLEAEKSTPEAEFVAALLANNAELIASRNYYFWDPLAAVVMSDPRLVTLTPRDVPVIDIPSAPDDGRSKPVAIGSEMLVAMTQDGDAFEAALISGWNSLNADVRWCLQMSHTRTPCCIKVNGLPTLERGAPSAPAGGPLVRLADARQGGLCPRRPHQL